MNWTQLPRPIIGLAPMDGITDAAYRELVDTIAPADILVSEFVPAEGVAHGATRLFRSLQRHKTKTPIIAQLFGNTPKAFYKAAIIVAELGFDGVDINMGCPAHGINKKGGGAGLIKTPDLAIELIRSAKQGIADWSEGISLETAHIPDSVLLWKKEHAMEDTHRHSIPVTVKTRSGITEPVTKDWISRLIEAKPGAITLHGRTLEQLYRGKADWEQVRIASSLIKGTGILVFGNGDVQSVVEAQEKAKKYELDGILIGRASLGNPWVFSGHVPSQREVFETMLTHCRLFMKYRSELQLFPMRKHLAWYIAGFDGAAKMRDALMHVTTISDVENILRATP